MDTAGAFARTELLLGGESMERLAAAVWPTLEAAS